MPGVSIRRNRHGYLVFRFYGLTGGQSERQRGTNLEDTPSNRKLMEAQVTIINDQMTKRIFDYSLYFKEQAGVEVERGTIDQLHPKWMERTRRQDGVRESLIYDRDRYHKHYISPAIGHVRLLEMTVEDLELFSAYLRLAPTEKKKGKDVPNVVNIRGRVLVCRGLSRKTARNVIDGPLRGMFRDHNTTGKPSPFEKLKWGKIIPKRREPFTAEEEAQILDHFLRHESRRHYYPLVHTLLHTGARPSELLGLRRGRLDLKAGQAEIAVSRTYGEDNPTKTTASTRTLVLDWDTVRVLRQAEPLNHDADSFVFVNTDGQPINLDTFRKHTWRKALRALGIKARAVYATRHTFISRALSNGANPKFIAEHTGTSLTMIEKHYGSYIHNDARQQLAIARGTVQATEHPEPFRVNRAS
jgi:integrase